MLASDSPFLKWLSCIKNISVTIEVLLWDIQHITKLVDIELRDLGTFKNDGKHF